MRFSLPILLSVALLSAACGGRSRRGATLVVVAATRQMHAATKFPIMRIEHHMRTLLSRM